MTGSRRRPRRLPDGRQLGAGLALAALVVAAWPAAAQEPLPPEKAFRFSARALDAHTVEARFTIADGYYLYRDRIHFAVEPAAAGLAQPSLPAGAVKDDQFFGRVETYRGEVVVKLAVKDPKPGQSLVISAESQGCADLGICYPVNVQRVGLALPETGGPPVAPVQAQKHTWFN